VDDLDQHFVKTWKAALEGMKAEDRPGAKKPAAGSAETKEATATGEDDSKYSSPAKSSSMEAAEEVAAMRKKRSQRRRDEAVEDARSKRNRTFAAIVAAIILVGGLVVGYLFQRNQADELAAMQEQAAAMEVDAEGSEKVTPDGEENVDAVRARIREVLDRRREEIQAGVLSEGADEKREDEEPGDQEVQQAMVNARRVAVAPTSEEATPAPDEKGFRKPMLRPSGGVRRPAAEPSPPPQQRAAAGSSGTMREKRSRDPGRLYYDLGNAKLEERNFGAALKSFQKSVDKSPECGRCWEGLALAHQALGNAQNAAAAFDKAEGLGVPVNAARP
jgi:tetratricopeptide (TPR) repeat protein